MTNWVEKQSVDEIAGKEPNELERQIIDIDLDVHKLCERLLKLGLNGHSYKLQIDRVLSNITDEAKSKGVL